MTVFWRCWTSCQCNTCWPIPPVSVPNGTDWSTSTVAVSNRWVYVTMLDIGHIWTYASTTSTNPWCRRTIESWLAISWNIARWFAVLLVSFLAFSALNCATFKCTCHSWCYFCSNIGLQLCAGVVLVCDIDTHWVNLAYFQSQSGDLHWSQPESRPTMHRRLGPLTRSGPIFARFPWSTGDRQ